MIIKIIDQNILSRECNDIYIYILCQYYKAEELVCSNTLVSATVSLI